MKMITLLTFIICGILPIALALPIPNDVAQSTTLLTVLAQQPDLSIFSFMIQQTGEPRPNPAFEERFNSALDTRNYTAFVPSNAAMLKLPIATLNLLARPQSYPLTESLIRMHIAEGLYTAPNITSTTTTNNSQQITSIEGFPLSVSLSATDQPTDPTVTLKLNEASLDLTDIPASNGRIQTLDRMLSPYSDYFGISTSSSAPSVSSCTQNATTIAEILASNPRLSTLNQTLSEIDPSFLTRLSLSKPNNEEQIYLAPSNEAFENIPLDALKAPSNVALSGYLLRMGMLRGNLGALNMMIEGEVESVSGWNVTARKRGEAFLLGNAVVLERDACASNGCVWIVDRLLDPLFGAMG
ncbi:hypothetical protein IFR05_010459 [Cadophora sp. M221]|nr:hypothetical protein IFR05_010459 [Cadophora sp. M221]